jgi:dTDP-4-amino-4,6-dideoxygalactose transaminase
MTNKYSMFEKIKKFEEDLAQFTGAKYAISTDCCTHAIELCMVLDKVKSCNFSAYTYLSIPQLMHKMKIEYNLIGEDWTGEYQFHNTRIWDSARRLEPNMHKLGQLQCLSFGHSKPVNIGRGGAILTDSYDDYVILSKLRYDGRDLNTSPWQNQKIFSVGYHYKLNPEECERGTKLLKKYKKAKNFEPKKIIYPDCRLIKII